MVVGSVGPTGTLTPVAVLLVTEEVVRVAVPLYTQIPPPSCAKKEDEEEEGEETCMREGPIESEREERSETGRTVGMHDGGGVGRSHGTLTYCSAVLSVTGEVVRVAVP